LSGLLPGTYTTAQRDAIPAGQRPTGLQVFNTTTSQLEVNKGTDAAPSWVAIGFDAFPVGSTIPYIGNEGSVPAGWSLADGGTLSRTTYAALNSLLSAQSYPFGAGDGSTTFNKPDMRGRTPIARDNMGGTAASRMAGVNSMGASGGAAVITLALNELPAHDHAGSTASTTGSHSHGGATGSGTSGSTAPSTDTEPAHTHGWASGGALYGSAGTPLSTLQTGGSFNVDSQATTAAAGAHAHVVNAHTHSVPALSISADGNHTHTITVASQGGGNSHSNLQPYLALNWIVKVL
jgi:microcystin-dependent protein